MKETLQSVNFDDLDVGVPTGHPIANVYFHAAQDLGLEFDIYHEARGIGVINHDDRHLIIYGRYIGLNDLSSTQLSANKSYAARCLSSQGVPVPAGDPVTIRRAGSLEQFARKIIDAASGQYPICIKPVMDSHGRFVVPDIRDEEELLKILFERRNTRIQTMMFEPHCRGVEYRVIVACGEIVGCALRTPPSVTGDGTSTLEQLVAAYNAPREVMSLKPAIFGKRQRFIVERRHSVSPQSVVPQGQEIILDDRCNLAVGGNIYFVDPASIQSQAQDICLQSAECFNLDLVGIDLMGDDITSGSHWVVNEVNSQPGAHVPVPTMSREQRLAWPKRLMELHFGLTSV